jgi:hypothetical protein
MFFYDDKTSIVAHAVSGLYMHGAAVMLGYSELLLLKVFSSLIMLKHCSCSWSRFWSIVRLSRYSIIDDVLSSRQPLISDEFFLVHLCIMKHADIAVTFALIYPCSV